MLLDTEQLGELKDLLDDDFAEFVARFCADTKQRIAKLEAETNLAELAQLAHSLKGSALNMACQALAMDCMKLEQAARDNDEALVKRTLAQLPHTWQITQSALRAF